MSDAGCVLCKGAEGDVDMLRVAVWEDELWRLTTSLVSEVPGFSYLEPRRHIPDITRLDGDEAATLGPTLSKVTEALRIATSSELVYIYVFGDGIPHLHVHLAPHRKGDPLNDAMVKGEFEETQLETGATIYKSEDYPLLPEAELREIAEATRHYLSRDG